MIIEQVIRKLKNNPGYKWESNYSTRDLLIILLGRFNQIIRGLFLKPFLKKSKGLLLFIGKKVSVKHAHQVSTGNNLILEDNVYINALSLNGINFGNNVSIARNSILICTAVIAQKGCGINIGHNTGINAGAYLGGQGGIEIGSNVIIGPMVRIFSENHNYENASIIIKEQGTNRKKVVINDDCWIGAGVTILSGVIIGKGCVIGAGSIVTKSTPENAIVVGVPAKVVNYRKENFEQTRINE